MSFHLFFALSEGLSASLWVPAGTYESIMEHVVRVEAILKLERHQDVWTDDDGTERRNPVRWKSVDLAAVNPVPFRGRFDDFGDEILQFSDDPSEWSWAHPGQALYDDIVCATAEWHNHWVLHLYLDFAEWSKAVRSRAKSRKKVPAGDLEELTPAMAAEFWHALTMLEVPVARWSRAYYRARMEALYEVMRGRPTKGVSFDADPLTEAQAAAVIRVIDQYLDRHDLRLDVPNGRDELASSYDGGYDWCQECGPMHPDDWPSCAKGRKCPLIQELGDEEEPE